MTIHVPSQGVYRIDPVASGIDFRAKHQFGTGTVRGSFALTGGAVVVADPHEGSTAHASADARSFLSGNKIRDRKVKSKAFLDAETYPEISFASTSFRQTDDVWRLGGILTARGVAAAANFTIESLELEAEDIVVSATAKIDRYAHGITAARGMAGRHLWLTVDVRARRQD
jgi:polyisoprenoid-binding protein YceI